MKTVLITGGNGFVGRHLVLALQCRGDSARVFALPDEDVTWLEQRHVEVYRGDVRDPESLISPMSGCDSVFHLAAMMDVWRTIEDYRAVNVTGTENVCRAALSAGVGRIVHMSSTSVYGMELGRPVDETFRLRPFRDPYPVTKAEADIVVQQMIVDEHLPAVIIRPDQIFGPGDHLHFGRMAERLAKGKGVVVGKGDNALPFVYVSDLVDGLLLAHDHPHAVGQAYNITNDHPLTQQQLLDAIAREIGVKTAGLHIPYRLLYAAGYLAEHLARFGPSSVRPPITRLGVAFFGTDNRYVIDKARRELGFRPRVDLEAGVRDTAAWYVSQSTSFQDGRVGQPIVAR